ncbi:hypothetical protein LCGC14_2843540, partial [marine sediment metagenome]
EVPEGEETVPEQDATEGEQPREKDGRYASPEDKSPEGQADKAAPDETLEVREEADAGAAAEAEPTPYRYRSSAADYEVAGATVGADGVLSIPADSVPHLTQLLASGREYSDTRPRVEAAFQQQVKQAQSEVETANKSRDVYSEHLEKVFDMSPEQRLDWAEGFSQQWPEVKAGAEKAGVEASRQADRVRLEQYERDAYVRELEPQLQTALEEHMTRAFGEDPLFKGMTVEDLRVVYGKLLNGWQTNGTILNADGSVWNGERDPQINLVQMRREMEYVASLRRQKDASTEKVTEAKKTNEAELSENKAPPSVSSQTGPSPGEKPAKQFKPSGKEGSDPTEEVDDWAFGG